MNESETDKAAAFDRARPHWVRANKLLAEMGARGHAGKDVTEAVCDELEKIAAQAQRYREALEIIRDCPPDAVHLMPMAADAALQEDKTNG